MFKKLIALCAAALFTASVAQAEDSIGKKMGDKAVSGGIDMVTGIVEFPVQIYKGYDNGFGPIKNKVGSKTVGTVLGVFRGIGHAAGRTSWGALELFGFWTAAAEDNEDCGVPLDAQYAWEMGEQYSIFKPTLGEGVKPIGNKLVRGVTDAYAGICELPGQIVKGVNEGEPVKGVGKGIWYFVSREVYGFGSVLTCIVPNPEDNPGFHLEQEWPWDAFNE